MSFICLQQVRVGGGWGLKGMRTSRGMMSGQRVGPRRGREFKRGAVQRRQGAAAARSRCIRTRVWHTETALQLGFSAVGAGRAETTQARGQEASLRRRPSTAAEGGRSEPYAGKAKGAACSHLRSVQPV